MNSERNSMMERSLPSLFSCSAALLAKIHCSDVQQFILVIIVVNVGLICESFYFLIHFFYMLLTSYQANQNAFV